jgi:catechol 2,3-dioxygenase
MSHTPKYLGHVNLYVRNAERSKEWYESVLGLHTYDFMPGRAAFMSANKEESHEVALMEVGENAPSPQPGGVGLNHMAWKMERLEDLKELYNHLKVKKVPIDRVTDHGISLGIYFHDPDGNGIEVYYEMPRHQWHRQEKLFMNGDRPHGQFPGPWDQDLARQRAAAR